MLASMPLAEFLKEEFYRQVHQYRPDQPWFNNHSSTERRKCNLPESPLPSPPFPVRTCWLQLCGSFHPFYLAQTNLHHLPLPYFLIRVAKLLMTFPFAPEERLTALGAFCFSFPFKSQLSFNDKNKQDHWNVPMDPSLVQLSRRALPLLSFVH